MLEPAEAPGARAHEVEADRLVAEATRLLVAAREHKRTANRHRRRMKEGFQELDDLVSTAARRGIHITINAESEGGQSVRAQTASGRKEPGARAPVH